jgi:hypothetical protein
MGEAREPLIAVAKRRTAGIIKSETGRAVATEQLGVRAGGSAVLKAEKPNPE